MPPDLARPAAAFGIAMIAVLWTNDAWYCVTYRRRDEAAAARPAARLFIGMLVLTLIYVVVNLAYLYACTIDELQGRDASPSARRRRWSAGARSWR